MNKTDLAAAVLDRCRESGMKNRADARRVVDAVFDVVTETVGTGERVSISGFGSFEVVRRAARRARNVATGEFVDVPPRNAVAFHAGKVLRESVRDASLASGEARETE